MCSNELKVFENNKIRSVYDEEKEKWYFSVVDLIAVLTDSKDPAIYMEKELRYHDKGIKVLSLFFIDEVKKYRTETGEKGIYAQMFEECYEELINKPKYQELKKWFNTNVAKAHNGYFSQDKKGNKNTKGDTQADDDTYNTICNYFLMMLK